MLSSTCSEVSTGRAEMLLPSEFFRSGRWGRSAEIHAQKMKTRDATVGHLESAGSPWGMENRGGRDQGSRAMCGRGGKLEQCFWVGMKPFLHPPYCPGMRARSQTAMTSEDLTGAATLWAAQRSRLLVWVPVRVSLHMGQGSSVHLFICLSVCLFDHLVLCPSVYLSMCLFICLSISSTVSLCMFIHPPIYQNYHPSICHLSVYLPVLFHISISYFILRRICAGSLKTKTIIKDKQTHAQKNRRCEKPRR